MPISAVMSVSNPLPAEVHAILNGFKEPAIVLGRDYRILIANDAYRRSYGSLGEPRQQFCYQVSHRYTVPCDMAGESCPLKESLRTGNNTSVLHIHHTPRGEEYVNVEMWPIKDPLSGETMFFIEHMRPSEAAATQASQQKLVGRSASFKRMLGLIERVANSDTTAMLLGETGTGKELVAQTIHRLSDRNSRPFVPVECTGLPEALFESELFGYAKGAFTGASSAKAGMVEAADKGTLFLDEVGEIPLADQVKLLRLLETRRYRRVGSTEWREADFRLICATNKGLSDMVADGTFREDLYYRLCVFEIHLPPLRDRIADLELLIDTILARLGASDIEFSADALAVLKEYAFPGNIRELRNIVERAILLADGRVVEPADLPPQCTKGAPSDRLEQREDIIPLATAERRYLQHVLATHVGDRKALASKLGISERALYRKLAELRDEEDQT